jgi:Berberine and berberine like
MRSFTTGSDYVNQIGLETDERSERIKAAYRANYERLVALKNKYDPTNLFRRKGQHFRAAPEIRNDFVLLAAARARR